MPVVFITGCSAGGIGAALVASFLDRKCFVYASARSLESMSSLEHENLKKLRVDVTDEESIKAAVSLIYETDHNNIDIFVSNAGLACVGPVLDISLETAQRVMDTNLFGTMRLLKYIAPLMIERGSGLIVPIGSSAGNLGVPFMGIYNASKAATHAYAETLTREIRPFGIKVMLVIPGSVKSNISNNEAKVYGLPEGSFYTKYKEKITEVLYYSQTTPNCMPTTTFAKGVVNKALSSHPPASLSIGGGTGFMWVLSWLPRTTALDIIWRYLVGKQI